MKKLILLMVICASLMGANYTEVQKRMLKFTIENNGGICGTIDKVRSERRAKHVVICDGFARSYVINASVRPWKVRRR